MAGHQRHKPHSCISHSCWAEALTPGWQGAEKLLNFLNSYRNSAWKMQQLGRCGIRAGTVWFTRPIWFKEESLVREPGTKKSSSSGSSRYPRPAKISRSCTTYSMAGRDLAGGRLALQDKIDTTPCLTAEQA